MTLDGYNLYVSPSDRRFTRLIGTWVNPRADLLVVAKKGSLLLSEVKSQFNPWSFILLTEMSLISQHSCSQKQPENISTPFVCPTYAMISNLNFCQLFLSSFRKVLKLSDLFRIRTNPEIIFKHFVRPFHQGTT
jgi:hypothetical protein